MTYLSKEVATDVHMGLTNGEVVVPVRSISALDDAGLVRAIRGLAKDYELLADHLGGALPSRTVEEALQFVELQRKQARSTEVKRELTKTRRKEFSAVRTHLLLALIERDGYVCQSPGCKVQDALSIDHIIPLSRGGTDEISNLRLLCISHNSQKGAKLDL